MKGIDIIEAFGEIDDDLLLDAKCHKKTAPRWLKWASLAACLCCVTALTVLSLSRLAQEPAPADNAMAPWAPAPEAAPVLPAEDSSREESSAREPAAPPTEEPSPTPEPPQASAPESPQDLLELTSARYQVTLRFPADYAEEITADDDFSDPRYDTNFSGRAFMFVDHAAQTANFPGLVWSISAIPKEEHDQARYEEFEDSIFMYNSLLIGADDRNVYLLDWPDPGFQFDLGTPAAARSYYLHVRDGLTILEDFVTQNGLEESTDWQGIYREKLISRMAGLLGDIAPEELTGNGLSSLRADLLEIIGLTPEAPAYAKYGCRNPAMTLYVQEDNPVELETPSAVFRTDQHIAFSIQADYNATEDEKRALTLYVIRDAQGLPVLVYSSERTWNGSWHTIRHTGTLPDLPQTPGAYTLEVYYDGYFFAAADFTVE